MKKVPILADGPSEEVFVKHSLRPHLLNYDVMLIPKIVTSKRVKNGPDSKGALSLIPRFAERSSGQRHLSTHRKMHFFTQGFARDLKYTSSPSS